MKPKGPSPEVLDAFESIKLIALLTLLLAFIPFALQNFLASFAAKEYVANVHLRTTTERKDARILRAFETAKRTCVAQATLETEKDPKQDTRDATLTVTAHTSKQTIADATAMRDGIQAAFEKEGPGKVYDMDHVVYAKPVPNQTMALVKNICRGLSLVIVVVGLGMVIRIWPRQPLPPLAILGVGLTILTVVIGSGGRGNGEIIGFLILVGVPVGLIILLARLTFRTRRAASWIQGRALIVSAHVEAKHYRFSGEVTRIKNVAAVTYEFEADGQKIQSDRISLGVAPADNVDETMRKYRAGSHAPVFYDPANPEDCALERDLPVKLGCLWSGAAVGLLIYIGLVAFMWKGDAINRALGERFPKFHRPLLAIVLGSLGLFCLGSAIYNALHRRKAFDWVRTKGKIVGSTVESYRSSDGNTSSVGRPMYKAVVEFSYEVDGQEYHNNTAPAFNTSRDSAEATVARNPAGQEVDVYYDPKNPASSGLNIDTNMMLDGRASLVVALILLGLAALVALH
jgi:hypothetical protein